MKVTRFAPLSVSVLVSLTAACEATAPPPAPVTPRSQVASSDETPPPPPAPADPPPPPPASTDAPAQGDAPAASPDGSDTVYASGEYTIGADSGDYDDDDPAALTDFRTSLDGYGTWTDDPTYGTVWVPSASVVGGDFVPYVSAGHWAFDDDWVWVSDYAWGWGPFHYGRWVFIDGRGWSWIPGRAYRGAWVTWGVDDGYAYVAWAPLAPTFVWVGGAAVAFPGYVGPRWAYCARGDVFSPAVRTRVLAGPAATMAAARMHPYEPASPAGSTAGPPPQRLGFDAAQIPRTTAATAASVTQAREFSRASTAQALGAHPPTRTGHGTRVRVPRAGNRHGAGGRSAAPGRPQGRGAGHHR